MLKFIKKIFGTKYDKDVKSIQPYVEKTNGFFEQYNGLSHDELRNKSIEFRERIAEHLSGIDQDIANAKQQAIDEPEFGLKEEIYRQIDEYKKERDEHLEEILLYLLPEAFAVVKETAIS